MQFRDRGVGSRLLWQLSIRLILLKHQPQFQLLNIIPLLHSFVAYNTTAALFPLLPLCVLLLFLLPPCSVCGALDLSFGCRKWLVLHGMGSDWEQWPPLQLKSKHLFVKTLALVLLLAFSFRLLFSRSAEVLPAAETTVAAVGVIGASDSRQGAAFFFWVVSKICGLIDCINLWVEIWTKAQKGNFLRRLSCSLFW